MRYLNEEPQEANLHQIIFTSLINPAIGEPVLIDLEEERLSLVEEPEFDLDDWDDYFDDADNYDEKLPCLNEDEYEQRYTYDSEIND